MIYHKMFIIIKWSTVWLVTGQTSSIGDRYGKAAITILIEQATHHISPNLQLGHSVQIFSAAYEWKW